MYEMLVSVKSWVQDFGSFPNWIFYLFFKNKERKIYSTQIIHKIHNPPGQRPQKSQPQ